MIKSEKAAVVDSSFYSNFNYIPFVRHFSICESIRKIEKIQKYCLRIVFDDFESDYDNTYTYSKRVESRQNITSGVF